jgi:site-specific DNA recombinase
MSKAARGEVLGRTPYGYVVDIDGTFRIERSEAALVRRLFDLYAGDGPSGEGGESDDDPGIELPATGPGLRRIAGLFNGEGLRTRSGRPWTPVTLSGMLRNRVYTGSYVRYGIRIAGNHDRIVERDVFNRAQVIMASRSPVRKKRVLRPYLLSGIARCWSCGQGMHGLERNRRWTRVDGSKATRSYRYYACPSRSAGVVEDEAGEEQPHPGWREADLDRATLDALRAEPIESLRASFSPSSSDTRNDDLRTAEQRFMESVRAVASGRGGVPDLATALSELQTTRNMTEADRADGSGDFSFEDALGAFDTAEPDELHAAIASFVDRVIVHADRVEPVLRTGPPE